MLATLGGQTGLNLVMELAEEGYLDRMGVKIIGTQAPAIKKAEDRLAFQETMQSIGEPCIDGLVIETVEDACAFAEKIGYPRHCAPRLHSGRFRRRYLHRTAQSWKPSAKTVCAFPVSISA